MSVDLTGFLICFRTWEDLDINFDNVNIKLPKLFSNVNIRKGYNPNGLKGNIPYPFTLALVVNCISDLKALDNILCDHIDFTGDHEIYTGHERIYEYFGFFDLNNKYIPGILKTTYGRCELKGFSAMSCMMCHYGHILECHYPLICSGAKCNHYSRYDETLN